MNPYSPISRRRGKTLMLDYYDSWAALLAWKKATRNGLHFIRFGPIIYAQLADWWLTYSYVVTPQEHGQ